MTIRSILNTKGDQLFTIEPDAPATEVARVLLERRIGAAPVVEGSAFHVDSMLGLVSERDLVHALARLGAGALDCTARELMTSPVVTIPLHASVADAMELMTDRRIRHLPVTEGRRLVGLVSIGDLVKRRIQEAEQEAHALKHYIASS